MIVLFFTNETVMFCGSKIAQLGKDFVEIDPSRFFSTVDGVQKNMILQKPVWGGGGSTNLLPYLLWNFATFKSHILASFKHFESLLIF